MTIDSPQTILLEASLSRIHQHVHGDNAIAIISAYRDTNGDPSKGRENVRKSKELAARLKHEGFGYFWVIGGFWEDFTGTEEEWQMRTRRVPGRTRDGKESRQILVEERSIFVISRQEDSERLFDLLTTLAKRYDQDSFLFKKSGEDVAIFYTKMGTRQFVAGKFRTTHIQDYFSKIRNKEDKKFVFTNVVDKTVREK